MALPDWVPITGLVSGVIMTVVGAIKVRPESRKMRQDGTAALMTSTGAILSGVQEEMHELRTEVRALRAWRHRVETAGKAHSRWDDQVVTRLSEAGIEVPEPPPLFGGSEDAA